MKYETVYLKHAAEYDRLIQAEDCDGNLLPALEAIVALDGARVVDVGTGTGRIARMLVGRAQHVTGVEPAKAMLDVARRHLQASGRTNWQLHCADARELPVASGSADVAVAGWVFGHLRHWLPTDWRASIGRALDEMERCVVPGGTVIVIETLGTGQQTPAPPNEALAEYFAWLQDARGFARTTIRTDYAFDNVAMAKDVCGFFFGEKLTAKIEEHQWSRVPECTGIWSRRKS